MLRPETRRTVEISGEGLPVHHGKPLFEVQRLRGVSVAVDFRLNMALKINGYTPNFSGARAERSGK